MVTDIRANDVRRAPMSSLRGGRDPGSTREDELISRAARDTAVATSQTTRPPPSIRSPVKTRRAVTEMTFPLPLLDRVSGNT